MAKSIPVKLFRLFITSLCLHALLVSAGAQAAEWMLQGKVLEKGTRKPLQGTFIAVREQDSISAISDEQGHFELMLPGAGVYTLTAAAMGSGSPVSIKIEIKPGEKVPFPVFYLTATTSLLPEIVVSGERNAERVGKTVISGAELRRIPGAGGDPLRGLQALPGVVAGNNGASPAIRGSGPGDNLYYVDSLPVGKIFHFGGISVFNGDLVQDFNLYSAAFAPRYGDITGAVLDVALREPRNDRLGGKANLSLTGADFLIEGPVNADQAFFFAARRSYFDLLVKRISQQGVTLQVPNYHDYQGKYLFRLNGTDRLTLHMQGAADELKLNVTGSSDIAKQQPALSGELAFSDAYSMQAAVWDARIADDAQNKLALEHIASNFDNTLASAGHIAVQQDSQLLREQIRLTLPGEHELSLGMNLARTQTRIDADFNNATCTQFNPGCDLTSAPRLKLTETFDTNAWELFAQDRKRLGEKLTLSGGVHHSSEDYLKKTYTEPRLGLEWDWDERTLLTAGWGRHNQLPTGQQIARSFGNPHLDHLRAEHSVVGISRKQDNDWTWKAESYYKKLSNLVVNDTQQNYINGASGKAYGVELLVKKEGIADVTGWLAISLARSERRNDITGEAFRFQYDQPVNLTLVANRKLDDDWTLGAKWNYHSGAPYTPVLGTSGTYPDGRPIPVYAPVNSGTLPDYHRLDVRLDRTYVYDTWKLNVYLEFNNVYFRKNISGYRYDPSYTKKEPVYPLVIPVSFGVQGEF